MKMGASSVPKRTLAKYQQANKWKQYNSFSDCSMKGFDIDK